MIDEVREIRLAAVRLYTRIRGPYRGFPFVATSDEADLLKIEHACDDIIKRHLWSQWCVQERERIEAEIVEKMLEPEGTGDGEVEKAAADLLRPPSFR